MKKQLTNECLHLCVLNYKHIYRLAFQWDLKYQRAGSSQNKPILYTGLIILSVLNILPLWKSSIITSQWSLQ